MKYFIGEQTAQYLRESMAAARGVQSVQGGAMRRGQSMNAVVDEYPHPYELRWAASSGETDAGGEPKGAWIIWLPAGCLVIDGETVDVQSQLTTANGYPAGWYDLTSIFEDGEAPESFDLYLDAEPGAPLFGIEKEDLVSPVLIAQVAGVGKVKGVVESALVYGEGAKKPFDIVAERVSVDNEEKVVRKVVRCTFRHMGTAVELEDFTLPDEWSGSDTLVLARRIPSGTILTSENWNTFWSVALKSQIPAESSGEMIDTIRLYDFDYDGNIEVDYRDADVNLDWGFKDNNTIADNDPTGAGRFNMGLHLKQFYGTERDLAHAPAVFDVLVRYSATTGGTPGLYYMPRKQLEEIISSSSSGSGSGSGSGEDPGEDPGEEPGEEEPTVVPSMCGSFAYDSENKRIRDGAVMVGRQAYLVHGIDATNGLYRVKVAFGQTGGVTCTLELGDGFMPPTDSESYIPVMELSYGEVVADWRGGFVVPAYD